MIKHRIVAVLCAAVTVLAASTAVGASAAEAASSHIGRARGFDTCSVPTAGQMSVWAARSPYSVYATYLGGANFAGGCVPAYSWWTSQVVAQGWNLSFTWVGAQAPTGCATTRYSTYMSSAASTAYYQGRQEGLNAYRALGRIGVTQRSAPIVYDLEGYYGGSTCRAASRAFMKGWADMLKNSSPGKASAQHAGVYGSACSSYLADLASDGTPPDFIWGADWDGISSPSQLSCVAPRQWIYNQRDKQWKGPHVETWGGVSLVIDSDCFDAPVYGNRAPYDGACS